ncbi:MAG TPA: hypoxanthine phosphoribosyltransferase [Elusimicrobiales bacterium]|nr:hypoxanthine phosphoribosyltransferase [Elusimicrobiales bacterium]
MTTNHPAIDKILISKDTLQKRVQELAKEISQDYKNTCPVFIGVLKGSVMFLADLMKNTAVDHSVDFLCPSSYAGGTKSTGIVRLLLDLRESIEGKDVLLVEDIVDTGLTMNYLLENLRTRRPRSLEICTLLDKSSCRKVSVPIRYRGFEIPNEFVVGYGLDYRELYRNLPYIGVMKPPKAEKNK